MLLNKFFNKTITIILTITAVLISGGCDEYNSPVVVGSQPGSLATNPVEQVGSALRITKRRPRVEFAEKAWYPPENVEKDWTAIVIHHSATENGDAALFDKWHKARLDDFGNHWEGVGYHFVIGNGTLSGDGEIEPTFRWYKQKTGAHCKTDESNWANRNGVGICLVGNFNEQRPTFKQMQSLLSLTRFLRIRYGIKPERIYGHGQVPGAGATDCPGRKFNMREFKGLIKLGGRDY